MTVQRKTGEPARAHNVTVTRQAQAAARRAGQGIADHAKDGGPQDPRIGIMAKRGGRPVALSGARNGWMAKPRFPARHGGSNP